MPPVNTTCTASDPADVTWCVRPVEQKVYALAGRLARWFASAAALLCVLGLYVVFFVLPDDPHYSQHYRILLIHIPTVWMGALIYLAMAASIGLGHMTAQRIWYMVASALAPTGAMFAFLSLWSGSLWGKPTWGAWWVWDTNAVAAVLQLLLCLSFVAVQAASEDQRRGDRLSGNIILIGLMALPLIYFATEQWGGARGGSLSLFVPPGVVSDVFVGLKLMTAGLVAYATAVTLTRLRIVILERDRKADWVFGLAGE